MSDIDPMLDKILELKAKLRDIEEQNRKLKISRTESVRAIKKAESTIQAEAVAIRYFDQKVDANTNNYYSVSDEIKEIEKTLGKQK